MSPRIIGDTVDMRITGDHPTTYATARGGTGGLFSANAQDIRCGQDAGGIYVYRGYASFTTSVLGASASVISASLGLKLQQRNITTGHDFVVQIWRYAWLPVPDGSGTGSNRQVVFQLVSSGALNGQAAVIEGAAGASQSTSGKAAGTTLVFSGLTPSWVSTTGVTRYVVRSKKDTDAVAPTASEWVKFYSADDATESNRPYLDVDLATGASESRRIRIYASGTITPVAFVEMG